MAAPAIQTPRNPTMTDVLARLDAKGNLIQINEILKETNEMQDDATFLECNNRFSHITNVRSGLPTVTWRKLNYGVQPSKSQVKRITDSCGMLEAFAKIDKKLAELNGMKASWRTSENAAFVEAMSQEWQRAIMYGDSSKDPEKIMGFTPRFNSKKAKNAVNILDAGGTGPDLTSIWLIGWGPNTVHCIYPQNSTAGLKEEDLGEEAAYDDQGGEYRVLKTHYSWDVGLTVRDWRYVVRICNVNWKALQADPDRAEDKGKEPGARLLDLLTIAEQIPPNLRNARFAFYCNNKIRTWLALQSRNAKNVSLAQSEVQGRGLLTTFDGIPVRRVDAISLKEAAVH